MALIGIEGWDNYRQGDPSPFDNGALPNGAFTGANTRFNYGQAAQGASGKEFHWNVNNQATIIQGVAFYESNSSGTSDVFILFEGGTLAGNIQIYLLYDRANRQLHVYRGSGTTNLLGSSAVNAMPPAANWSYVEWKVLISDAAGTVEVRIDNVVVISLTGVDTKARTNAYATVAAVCAASTGCRVDDYYLFDGSGSTCNAIIGGARIYTGYPVSDSAVQFTPSTGTDRFANVDDPGDIDGDTTYNSSSTAGQKDLFGITGSLVPVTATVSAVELRTTLRKDDAGARTARGIIRSGGTVANGATQNPGTSYVQYRDAMAVDPTDSNPWTPAKVNALEIGYEIVS